MVSGASSHCSATILATAPTIDGSTSSGLPAGRVIAATAPTAPKTAMPAIPTDRLRRATIPSSSA